MSVAKVPNGCPYLKALSYELIFSLVFTNFHFSLIFSLIAALDLQGEMQCGVFIFRSAFQVRVKCDEIHAFLQVKFLLFIYFFKEIIMLEPFRPTHRLFEQSLAYKQTWIKRTHSKQSALNVYKGGGHF